MQMSILDGQRRVEIATASADSHMTRQNGLLAASTPPAERCPAGG